MAAAGDDGGGVGLRGVREYLVKRVCVCVGRDAGGTRVESCVRTRNVGTKNGDGARVRVLPNSVAVAELQKGTACGASAVRAIDRSESGLGLSSQNERETSARLSAHPSSVRMTLNWASRVCCVQLPTLNLKLNATQRASECGDIFVSRRGLAAGTWWLTPLCVLPLGLLPTAMALGPQ